MTECTFPDEPQPTESLPRWATISQISSFLAIPRTTVRGTVRRALASDESWVKKEDVGDGKSQHLIDTTHETYKSHEQRWKQNQATRGEDATVSPADWYRARQPFFSHMRPEDLEETSIPPNTSPSSFSQFSWHKRGSFDDVLYHWPVFRQRLHSWGIQVFQNILAEEGQENPWQWRWGDLYGEGYPNEEEAIIAAIESRLMNTKEDSEDQALADALSTEASRVQSKAPRFTLFSGRHD